MKNKIPSIIKQIQNYKPIEINYAFQKSISYSQLSMYLQCPKKWALNYRDGHKTFAPSINMTFGTSIHETLQNYLSVMYQTTTVAADDINIEEYFEECFRKNYAEGYKDNNNLHFSNSEEMREFFDDGINILNFIKKKKGAYFNKKGWYLVGVEIPIIISPNKLYNNVLFNGFIDLVLYHEPTNSFTIYDFKTSRQSWGAEAKKDKIKQSQLILYKYFFSQQFGVDIENIKVEFMILKRKLWENCDYPQSHIQSFIPPQGKTSVNKSLESLNLFIEECFNKDGTYNMNECLPLPTKYGCKYCPFAKQKELCPKGIN
jgi:hypothetical protein